jgi:hypothetical protein
MSRFAAVPTAALDDERLEALHIRVLTALCSYADKDGWCRVGQDKIALRARTNPARVSQCIKDLSDWGWMRRQRVGKMKVNVYQVLMDCEMDAAIDLPTEQEELAETANHVTCHPSKSLLPVEQITLAPTANPIGTPFPNTVLNTADAVSGALTREQFVAITDRIFAVCGPGLVDPAKSATPIQKLSGRLTAWLTRYDLELDILPVLASKTAHKRAGKPIYDPTIFEDDIAAHHAARNRPLPTLEIINGGHERSSPAGRGQAYRGRGPSEDILDRALANLDGRQARSDIIEHTGPTRARAAAGGV